MKLVKQLICVALLIPIIFTMVHKPIMYKVNGSSMEPSLHDKQIILSINPVQIDKMDIVAIKLEDGLIIVKRVIAIPHDTVYIHDGQVYVNERPVDDIKTDYAGLAAIPYTLGEGQYFVLGDNRSHSIDSRYPAVSLVSMDQILGKIIFVN